MGNLEKKLEIKKFVEFWKGKGYEKGDCQPFWLSLLSAFGINHPEQYISFEIPVKMEKTTGYIDAYINKTRVLIEQKSSDIDLRKGRLQPDGTYMTPYMQAKNYANNMGTSVYPKWIITCNFNEFLIYNLEYPNSDPESVLLKDLPNEYYRLEFLIDKENEDIKKETEISKEAGDLVGELYDALAKQYKDIKNVESQKSLNKLCVRIVFCLYAEDANIFNEHKQFFNYLKGFNPPNVRTGLIELFKVLDTKEEDRDPYLNDNLKSFPYVNGGLFADENIEIPQFTTNIVDIILLHMCPFNWSKISPTIFGAVFESTLNPETRRSGGMHYTSIENIHKVIDSLFLDELNKEFSQIKSINIARARNQKLEEFRNKLAGLTFLDPACGSGNFLTETYISLRKLENEALELLYAKNNELQIRMDEVADIKVGINQFYGIEINDFAVAVAKTALWIAESQMMEKTKEIVHTNDDFLPLKTNANIVEANALKIDWETVVPKAKLNYIMGNPPFVGASMMKENQKEDAVAIFSDIKLSNSIDYVGAWYHKSAQYIQGTNIRVALVSTNSITQGEQVAPLWCKLFNNYNIHIDFAYRTFRWDSEANIMAHVHCVIIGFSCANNNEYKRLYASNRVSFVDNINAYLVAAPNVMIESRGAPICDVPRLTKGNQPSDGGHLILSEKEKDELLKNDNSVSCCVRRYVGAQDYLNGGEKRYCLWLKNIAPPVYIKNDEIVRRLGLVKQMRADSSAAPTRRMTEKPWLFFSTPQTDDTYLIIPRVSSERRKYIPIGFMPSEIIAADSCSIVPSATLYHMGVLTSNVHMAWMRAVCGRLEMRYRYSGGVVYNNFPWPTPTEAQKQKIEQTAQAILDARALYSDCSLADLYGDKMFLFPELVNAHRENDRAVMEAYGFWGKVQTESECVAELMKMYQELTK